MPISSRELLLILRARDEASKVLRGAAGAISTVSAASAAAAQKQIAQGAALTTVGVATAAAGLSAIKWLDNATKAATEYNNQSAKTLTQVDRVGVSLKTIKDIGRDVAAQVPVDFKKIQDSLYDIFSSMDVTVPEAKNLLTEFSKAATAGQVELQDASRATIGILNAYGLEASEVNHINDVMFQLVRKGVGTYGEFASTIGRAVPSAVRAGQSVETLAAMMAFLTRNGLSAAMASASAGRALDAISNPKTIAKFDDLGGSIDKALGKDRALALFGKNYKTMSVDIRDAEGNIRPMPAVMTDLGRAIGSLPAADRAAILQELFKSSGGTIQARRFFDIAVTQFGEFNQRAQEMINSKGAMAEAYEVMFDQPQQKIQLLANRWNILKTVIGDVILPFKMAIVEAFSAIIGAFEKLDPGVQKVIIIVFAVIAAILVLSGIVIAIAGVILMFQGALALAGTTFMALVSPILIVIGILAALAAIVFLVWKYHEQIGAFISAAWNAFVSAIQPALDVLKVFWEILWLGLKPALENIWNSLKAAFIPAWNTLKETWDTLKSSLADVWESLQRLGPILKVIGVMLVGAIGAAIVFVVGLFIILANVLANVLGPVFQFIVNVIKAAVNIIMGIIKVFVGILTLDWRLAWDGVKQILQGAWDLIVAIIKGVVGVVIGIFKGLIDGIVAVWKWLSDILVGHSIIPDMIKAIVVWFLTLPGKVLAAIAGLAGRLVSWATGVMSNLLNTFTSGGSRVVSFMSGLPSRIVSAISSLAGSLYNAGRNALNQLYNGVASAGQRVIDYVSNLAARVRNMWPFSPAKEGPLKGHPLDVAGANLMTDLADGIASRRALVLSYMKDLAYDVSETAGGIAPVVGVGGGGPAAGNAGGVSQQFYISTQEIDPVKHAADLGFEIARRGGN